MDDEQLKQIIKRGTGNRVPKDILNLIKLANKKQNDVSAKVGYYKNDEAWTSFTAIGGLSSRKIKTGVMIVKKDSQNSNWYDEEVVISNKGVGIQYSCNSVSRQLAYPQLMKLISLPKEDIIKIAECIPTKPKREAFTKVCLTLSKLNIKGTHGGNKITHTFKKPLEVFMNPNRYGDFYEDILVKNISFNGVNTTITYVDEKGKENSTELDFNITNISVINLIEDVFDIHSSMVERWKENREKLIAKDKVITKQAMEDTAMFSIINAL